MAKKTYVGKISAGVLAAAAAAAGTYLFAGKDAAKRRAAIAKMATKAKKDLASQLKKAEKVSKKVYSQVEKEILEQYRDLDLADIKQIKSELAQEWKNVQKIIKDKAKKPTAKKKTPVKKKAVKKTVKRR